MDRFDFPAWVDKLIRVLPVLAVVGVLYAGAVIVYACSPRTTDVGYRPIQPVAKFSHRTHAGELKMDCRYCHNTVEHAAFAAVPPTKTCINCHSPVDPTTNSPTYTAVHSNSPNLAVVHASWASGEPIRWKKVHDLPDYSYFNHAAHVTRGVSCVQCHGRIDKMAVVAQVEPLSMGWCLECHREPAKNLWPAEQVTNLGWADDKTDEELLAIGLQQAKKWNIPPYNDDYRVVPPEFVGDDVQAAAYLENPIHPQVNHNTNCSTCHR